MEGTRRRRHDRQDRRARPHHAVAGGQRRRPDGMGVGQGQGLGARHRHSGGGSQQRAARRGRITGIQRHVDDGCRQDTLGRLPHRVPGGHRTGEAGAGGAVTDVGFDGAAGQFSIALAPGRIVYAQLEDKQLEEPGDYFFDWRNAQLEIRAAADTRRHGRTSPSRSRARTTRRSCCGASPSPSADHRRFDDQTYR